MTNDFLTSAFILFAGLFGYYSLLRLHAMRLYDLQIGLDPWSQQSLLSMLLRFSLGCFANLIVAVSCVISWFWFNYLVDADFKLMLSALSFQIIALSIVISAASLILASHRIVVFFAIWFKDNLFLKDLNFSKRIDQDFSKFIASSSKGSHLAGAFLFVFFQMLFGYFLKILVS